MADRPDRHCARGWIRVVAIIALQLVVALAGVELALRLIGPGHHGLRGLLYQAGVATDYSRVDTLPELMEHSVLGFRPLESHRGYVLNSKSFRTPEYDEEKPDGVSRVLAVGDSFTYGAVPHAWTWASVLESGIAGEGSGPRVEILNLGVPGTGLPFHLRLWELEGSRLDADLVILLFFVGNDLVEGLGGGPGLDGFVDKVATVSHTARVVRNLLRARAGRATAPGSGPMEAPSPPEGAAVGGYELPGYADSFEEARPTFTGQAYLELETERMAICLLDQIVELSFRADRVAGLLEALDAGVRQAGGDLLVVLAPDEYQVEIGMAEEIARAAGRTLAEYDLEAPQRELTRRLERLDIDHLDLLPTLRAAAAAGSVYLPRDTHWNRRGNRLAARSIRAAMGL